MYHPTTRVLTVLELLQAHAELNGADIARRLEVDRRTVRRYIQMLQDMGIPIETTRGPHGSYRLRPGFKLPPLMLTDDEALAITLSLITSRRQGSSIDALATEGALAKIERVLPQGLRERVQAVEAIVAFSAAPTTPRAPQPDGALLIRLSTAAREAHRVRIRYHARGEETARTVDPYGVVCHEDYWYTVGWCHLRQDVRVFRVDRILDVAIEEETFARPPEFDSLRYVLDTLATAPWGWEIEVLLDTTFEHVQRRVPPGSALLEATPDGVVLRGRIEDLDWLARHLLTLECPFVVRQPTELRAALRRLAVEVATLADGMENSGSR